MKVIIDEREASLYELCLTHECLNKEMIVLEKRVLQLGDILFMSDDETTTFLCIERKSLQDLLASIKDGRYSEQSYRLTNCFPNPHNVVYLLEGMLSTVIFTTLLKVVRHELLIQNSLFISVEGYQDFTPYLVDSKSAICFLFPLIDTLE